MSAYQTQVVEEDYDESDDDEEEDEDYLDNCCLQYPTSITILLVVIFFVGGMILMSNIEAMNALDSLYVMTQIVTTIGYGESYLTPKCNTTKIFTAIYVLFCFLFVANILNEVGNKLIERDQEQLRDHFREIGAKKQEAKLTNDKTPVRPGIRKQLHLNSLMASVIIFLIWILVGTMFYALDEAEKKNWLESVYMSVITLSTVGFGDFTPITKLGKGFGIPWMFFGVLAMANMVGCVANTMGAFKKRAKSKAQVSLHILKAIDPSGKGYLTRSEFIQYMVVKKDLVKQKDIDQLKKTFLAMDSITQDGKVSEREIQASFGADEADAE